MSGMIGWGPRVLPADGPNACDGYPGGEPATDDDDAGPGGPDDCWAEDCAFGAEDEAAGGWVCITCTWE